MIRMTKLHLINWHNFQDDIIDFKNITYLLGVNAVGKTTIMDAVRYCLTTNKDFNTAGNKKSGRTLLGSVHQKQRAEDSYLRLGHTVSYIGIEFLDEAIKKTFVIIARVESETPKQDLKGVSQDWYITKPGYTLDDIPFFIERKEGKIPASREAFKLENKGMDRASNQSDARKRICRMLGIGDADSPIGKKFNEVFHMGTSLEDIKDIREFIYTYILPEPEVNIDFLQKDMIELERLQEILQEASDREALLKEINEKIKNAKELFIKVKINEILVAYANLQGNIEETNEKKYLIEEWESSLSVLKEKLVDLAAVESKTLELLYEAQRAAENNAENKELLSLESENKNNKIEENKLILESGIFDVTVKELFSLKDKLNKLDFVFDIDNCIRDENCLTQDRIVEIKRVTKIFADMEEQIKNQDAKIRTDIVKFNEESTILSNKIKSLESGIMYYPKEAIFVRDKINEALSEQSKKGDARLLCELLYMTDNSWQDAVESYLNTQRFNIIVEPDNYLLAKKVFISLGDRVKGIGVVDTRKIKDIEYKSEKESYLCDKIDSENTYARAYARFVMNDVICCESSDDLEKFSKSVTKDRLRFQSFCLQRMAKREHFIGVDAIEKQLKTAKKELVEIQKKLNELDISKKNFDVIYKGYTKFRAGEGFSKLEKYCESKKKAKELGIKIADINKKIEEFKKNPILLAMYDRGTKDV